MSGYRSPGELIVLAAEHPESLIELGVFIVYPDGSVFAEDDGRIWPVEPVNVNTIISMGDECWQGCITGTEAEAIVEISERRQG